MKAELGRKSESSRDVDLAFQNPVSEATLPKTPNPKWRCQACLAIRFSSAQFAAQQSWTKAILSNFSSDLKPVITHEQMRHSCPSGCQGWPLGKGQFHWWELSERQAQLHTPRAVFGNSILTGCLLKLSFHLPWWHHFLCCSETEAPEV